MHSDEMEDIQEAHAGQIVAVFGVDCASGDTFTDGSVRYTMTSMNVPDPVMSLAVSPVSKDSGGQFLKALNGFQKDYPTLHGQQTNKYYKKRLGVHATNQLLKEKQYSFSGKPLKVPIESSNDPIGEASCSLSPLGPKQAPKKKDLSYRNLRDWILRVDRPLFPVFLGLLTGLKPHAQKIEPTYISHHGANSKKRYVEPLAAGSPVNFEFKNMIVGQAIPSGFIPAIKKGFKEAANSGSLIGHPVENIRICLTDGVSHAVDSMLFCCKTCDTGAHHAGGTESSNRKEFQGNVAGDINKRKGVIVGSDQDGDDSVITAHVLLNNMSGYSTALHSMTQGTGEFTMEDKELLPISQDVQMQLVNSHKARKGTE